MPNIVDNDIHVQITNSNEKRFLRIRWYLLLLCLVVLCQSMITSGYIGSIVSSMEIYYGFSTEKMGIAYSSYDITGVISIPLISYFGSTKNRAKIVGIGAFLFSMGNILFILPYFVNGYHGINLNNISNETSDYFCRNQTNLFVENEIQPQWTYFVFILSMIIMSIGASPFYTLGITYLTDHLNKDDQPMYTSLLYGMVALGPALGFSMGSLFLSEWINIGEINNVISRTDPRWIGRWWAGFLISSSLLFILSFILFQFPSRLKENLEEEESNEDIQSSDHFTNFKEMLQSVIGLIRNVKYMLIVLINSIESILIVIFTTYLVKYIESVYNISSSLSSILIGSIVVPSAILGTISGGYIVRRFHLNIVQCIKLLFICCLVGLIGLIIILFLRCETNVNMSKEDQCSKKCNCSPDEYEPVCFDEKISYISPCYAGCTIRNGTEYLNCSCLSSGSEVSIGLCTNKCKIKLLIFLLILFVITYFETLMATPHLMILLRSVKHEIQSFSLGFENSLMKIIAQIPSPILIGLIIDKQCLYWSLSKLNQSTSCFIYNGNNLTFILFLMIILIKVLSIILIIILYLITSKTTTDNSNVNDEHQPLINDSS